MPRNPLDRKESAVRHALLAAVLTDFENQPPAAVLRRQLRELDKHIDACHDRRRALVAAINALSNPPDP